MPSESRREIRGRLVILLAGMVLGSSLAAGCAPNHIGRYNEIVFGDTKRVTNPILHSYDEWYGNVRYWVQDSQEEVGEWPGPTAADLRPPSGDYILGPGDVVRITIQDLLQEGMAYEVPVRVSEEGNLSLPFSYLQDIKAEGYTSRGLERRLAETLKKDGPLKEPRVTVFVMEYRNRTYAVIGGVRLPGIYALQSYDMTLFDGLSQAQGVNPFHEQYMYVVRKMSKEEETDAILQAWREEAEEEAKRQEAEKAEVPAVTTPAPDSEEMKEVAPPELPAPDAGEKPKDKPKTDLEELQQVMEGKKPEVKEGEAPAVPPVRAKEPAVELPEPSAGEGTEGWKFENGLWVPAKPGETAKKPPVEGQPGEKSAEGPESGEPKEAKPPFEPPKAGDEISPALRARLSRMGVVEGSGDGLMRIIRIDVAAFLGGDPSQNIVLRHGDRINLPEPPAGEWYINGEISRRGVYSLTGRKITLLQAIAAAGGLTELAVPQRTELVRRIGEDAEEIIYVDLAKVARGEAPDFYLQPNDIINVGTDQIAIFMAVLRNAFRATYGFGMVYDQNFADIYPWKGGIHPLFGGL